MTTANDGERLIEAVKKRDILYISTAKSYKDTNLKENTWREVATELGVTDKNGGYRHYYIFGMFRKFVL